MGKVMTVKNRKSLALGLFLMVGLASCEKDDGPDPTVEDGKPFPVCASTGKRSSTQQLIDVAVRRLIEQERFCSVKYSSPEQFYRMNPHCCDIDVKHMFFNQPIERRRLSGIGFMIGQLKMYHYCGSPKKGVGQYTIGYANITSCDVITEFTTVPAEQPFVGRFPKNSSGSD
jgi:hypothetical protein